MENYFAQRGEIYSNDFSIIEHDPSDEYTKGLHFHDFYEIQVFFADAGTTKVGGSEYKLHSGDILFLRMFEPHCFIPSPGCNYHRFAFNLDPTFLLAASSEDVNLLSIFDSETSYYPIYHFSGEHFQVYRQLIQKYEDRKTLGKGQHIYERGVIYEFLGHLYNDLPVSELRSAGNNGTIKIVADLLHYIAEHLADPLSPSLLSIETHFSEAYLCRVFRQYTGVTITEYINIKRIERAKYLLRGSHLISDICNSVGFNNLSYFYRMFKRHAGCTPGEYVEKLSESSGKNAE